MNPKYTTVAGVMLKQRFKARANWSPVQTRFCDVFLLPREKAFRLTQHKQTKITRAATGDATAETFAFK